MRARFLFTRKADYVRLVSVSLISWLNWTDFIHSKVSPYSVHNSNIKSSFFQPSYSSLLSEKTQSFVTPIRMVQFGGFTKSLITPRVFWLLKKKKTLYFCCILFILNYPTIFYLVLLPYCLLWKKKSSKCH